jgi:ribosomal protein S18 acetylase RimI-like enzyme
MVCARLRERQKPEGATDCRLRRAEPAEFAQTLGNFQGADTPQREAHAERLLRSTVTHEARVAVDDPGTVVACGEVAIEGALAGLYGVHTANGWRGRGVGAALCAALLDLASERGASAAYLQVEANNAAAHRLYARFGFVDAYRYHYRSPPEAA